MPYCRNRCTVTEMRADCLYLAEKKCSKINNEHLRLGLFTDFDNNIGQFWNQNADII